MGCENCQVLCNLKVVYERTKHKILTRQAELLHDFPENKRVIEKATENELELLNELSKLVEKPVECTFNQNKFILYL